MSSEAASPDEATSSDAKTSASPADADRTVQPAESVTSSSESEYLEFQNSDAENSPPAPRPSQPSDEQRCVFTVLCPPDGGPWARFTCALAFVAALICDGVCLSLFLLDSRVGMAEYLPPRTYTIEHVAAVTMFRYVIEPFVCAYINSYGFRYSLFFGGILSVTWMVLFLLFIENQFLLKHYWCLAIIGGIGAGMIKTSFFILISTLFVVKRQTAHSMVHLGSFTGMLLIPPFTEYVILTLDWKSALYFHLSLTSLTLAFWLLVATPVPLKIQVIDNELLNDTHSFFQSEVTFVSRNVAGNIPCIKSQTVWHTIGNRELRMVPFIRKIPVGDTNYRMQFLNPVDLRVNYWLFGNKHNRKVCCRNVTNMFRNRMIGSRPMYRDDIYFDGNVALLTTTMKNKVYSEYLMRMTRNLTVRDLNEEKYQRFKVLPLAMIRVLKSMLNMSIWCNGKFCLLVVGDALVHASCTIPFFFIKGPPELKPSAEAMIILIAGCLGLLSGRGIGHLLHHSSLDVVPPYHVCVVLIANGLSLFLCTSDDIGKTLPFFAIFGCLFGYYRSVQNSVLCFIFPLNKFNNVFGQISMIRGVASFVGVLIAMRIQTNEPTISNESVYVFAGLSMMAGGVCVGLLQRVNTAARGTRHDGRRRRNGRSPRRLRSRCVV